MRAEWNFWNEGNRRDYINYEKPCYAPVMRLRITGGYETENTIDLPTWN